MFNRIIVFFAASWDQSPIFIVGKTIILARIEKQVRNIPRNPKVTLHSFAIKFNKIANLRCVKGLE